MTKVNLDLKAQLMRKPGVMQDKDLNGVVPKLDNLISLDAYLGSYRTEIERRFFSLFSP